MATTLHPNYTPLDRSDVLRLLFHPRKTAEHATVDRGFHRVRIPVEEGIAIGARFHMTAMEGPTLLFFHGNGEIVADYDDIAPLFNRLGINLMAVDYRGYGCSDGNPTVTAMMADCHRILVFCEAWKEENGFTGPMIVMGRSLGSASALELAAAYHDRIAGLIVESGFAWAGPLLRKLGIAPEAIGFEESSGFANRDKIKRFSRPTLIIHAEFDHIIPFTDGQALFDASAAEDKTIVMIPGANHNDIFIRGLDRYLDAIVHLARKTMPG